MNNVTIVFSKDGISSIVAAVTLFIKKKKYELLLYALLQHLFIGIFLNDLVFYGFYIWPINMVILGLASAGVFVRNIKWKNSVRIMLFVCVLAFPIFLPFFKAYLYFILALNLIYVVFFAFIFWEIMIFLLKPSYINLDVISASACGYFLLIEISVFLMQFYICLDPMSFKGIDVSNSESTFIDMVYFCSITFTTIGFGDITPNTHYTKLMTSFLGIAGQFYSVVLLGILISKFTSRIEQS